MTLPHYSLPKRKITVTHSAVDYEFTLKTLVSDVFLTENAVSYTRFIADDYQSKSFLAQCDLGDNVKIEHKYQDQTGSSYTQIFGGWITELQPVLSMRAGGELLRVSAIGYGQAIPNMVVRQQYGTQSENSSLNTIKEVLTDATYGIIPKYVNKVMASATDSGYAIDTTKVADLTSDFKYLYFPGKPASKCLQDMTQLIRAANVPNAGAHWIVVPSGTTAYLCLATVGNHENPPVDVWPTWWNTDQAGSTIEVKKYMIISAFKKKRSEANYVLFAGNFRRPANGDIWSNNNSGDWDVENDAIVSDEAAITKIGSHSIRSRLPLQLDSGGIYYPSSYDLNLDITKIGTKHTIPRVGFYIHRNTNVDLSADSPVLFLGTGDPANNDYFSQDLQNEVLVADQWYHLSFPIGPYYASDETTEAEWVTVNNADWTDIDYVEFWTIADGANAYLYVDGLYFQGIVTRAAYDTTKIGSQKCKMMLYRDDVPKDDSLIATDDSGQVAQFCKAELYRAITEPITGEIVIPMKETIKAGQLGHIHFAKKSDGTFRIDKDMRILQVRHHFSVNGALSYLTLTDDVKSSYPLQPTDAYNLMMKATAPGFQDRVRGSLISKELDIDQTILEKSYAT